MPNPIAEVKKPSSAARSSPISAVPRSASDRTIRIVISNDQSIFGAGLRTVLGGHQDFTVVGEAASADEAVAITLERQPDLLLLDWTSGIDEP